jgi:nicotinamide mononucleotide transporter
VQLAEYISLIIDACRNTQPLEWFAVVTSLTYVFLAGKQQISCWIFAFVSSISYVIISYTTLLYVDALLNGMYALLAISGWINWKTKSDQQPIKQLSWKFHGLIVLGSVILGGISGYLLDNYTNQVFPYLDAVLFFLSISATWMITKKILENWIYFIVIDLAMVGIYFNRTLYLSSLLFLLYVLFAVIGYIKWRKELVK